MEIIFDTRGNEKQKAAARAWLDKSVLEIVYGGGKGGGKTYLLISLIFGDAFLYPGTHYFIARKKLNDLRRFTIPSIYEVFDHWGLSPDFYKYNGQDNFFELFNGSKVFLLEAKYMPSDPTYQRFGSMQMTRGAIEEAGEFELEAKGALQASIGRWKNDFYNLPAKLLQTCNPSKNYLYQVYKDYKGGHLAANVRFIQALPQDNKQLPKGYIENLEQALTKNEKERLLFGNWEYDDDPTTMADYNAIMDLFTNTHVAPGGKKYLVCDVARFGSDKMVLGLWEGLRLIKVESYPSTSTVDVEDRIKALAKEHQIPRRQIIIDEDGVGGGVVDHLKGAQGFVNNSKPLKEKGQARNYYNLQSQCAFKLAEKINANEIYIHDIDGRDRAHLVEELEVLRREDQDGKLKVINKDKVKKLIGRSPDFRDMLLMRMYFEIQRGGQLLTYGGRN